MILGFIHRIKNNSEFGSALEFKAQFHSQSFCQFCHNGLAQSLKFGLNIWLLAVFAWFLFFVSFVSLVLLFHYCLFDYRPITIIVLLITNSNGTTIATQHNTFSEQFLLSSLLDHFHLPTF